MKKHLIIFSLNLFIVAQLNAQTNTFPTSGNVGVGTTNPQSKLHLASGLGTNNMLASTISFGADVPTRTSKISGWRFANSHQMGLLFKTYNSTDIDAMMIDYLGNVGIGKTNPSAKLHVNGTIKGKDFITVDKGGSYRIALNGQSHGYIYGRNDSSENKFLIHSNGNSWFNGGNVGIGTTNPSSKLQVEGRASVGTSGILNLDWTYENNWGGSAGKWAGYIGFNAYRNNDDTKDYFYRRNNYTKRMVFEGSQNGFRWLGEDSVPDWGSGTPTKKLEELMVLINNGNLGIGTSTPDAKLAVKGNIHTNEVKVDLLGAVAPDYVFYKDYDLKTLNEVENYITKEGHLPNIPSAKEMEANGLLLKEMNLKLLEKIEELTLYTIQQEKEIKASKNEITILKTKASKVDVLEERLQKIEALLNSIKQ